jgi:quercetin dioxygenase-like cupin family protein
MGFVLQGRVTLELEDGSTADLVAGDAFVQQRSNHRWINAGSEAAVLGVIVVGTGNCA